MPLADWLGARDGTVAVKVPLPRHVASITYVATRMEQALQPEKASRPSRQELDARGQGHKNTEADHLHCSRRTAPNTSCYTRPPALRAELGKSISAAEVHNGSIRAGPVYRVINTLVVHGVNFFALHVGPNIVGEGMRKEDATLYP